VVGSEVRRKDFAVFEVEVNVAVGALGEGVRTIARTAGIRDLLAAERTMQHQAQVLEARVSPSQGQKAEPKAPDDRETFAGAACDRGVELRLGHSESPFGTATLPLGAQREQGPIGRERLEVLGMEIGTVKGTKSQSE
jgi:hypothetical protein